MAYPKIPFENMQPFAKEHALVSMRYADPVPFRTFAAKRQRQPEGPTTSDRILVSLLETSWSAPRMCKMEVAPIVAPKLKPPTLSG